MTPKLLILVIITGQQIPSYFYNAVSNFMDILLLVLGGFVVSYVRDGTPEEYVRFCVISIKQHVTALILFTLFIRSGNSALDDKTKMFQFYFIFVLL